jgi:hypothetical protein
MYGILKNYKTLNTYKNITTLESFGKLLVKLAMKEEGKSFTTKNIKEYINEWAEILTENSDGQETYTAESSTDTIADNLVYSNCHHYNEREPLTSEEKKKLYQSIASFLDDKLKAL